MRLALLLLVVLAPLARAQTVPQDSSRTDPVAADSAAARTVGVSDPVTGEVPTAAPPPYRSLDAKAARAVYRVEQPLFALVMRASNEAALPLFALAAPVSGGVALARGTSIRPALRVSASEVGTTAVVLALKNVLRRPRPYRAMEEITARDKRYTGGSVVDPNSFPSGHAGLSFAIATSVTLSDGRFAVPLYAWAATTSAARVWHGVHYPSDVLAGAVIGAGVAGVVHVLLPSGPDGDASTIPLSVTIPF